MGALGLKPFIGKWGGLLLGEPQGLSGERFWGTGLAGFWPCLPSKGVWWRPGVCVCLCVGRGEEARVEQSMCSSKKWLLNKVTCLVPTVLFIIAGYVMTQGL